MTDGILWYEIGRSDGQRKAGFEHSRDLDSAYATIRALEKQVHALRRDLAIIEPNRDNLHQDAWRLRAHLDQANNDIDRLIQALNEARRETSERVAAERRSAEADSILWQQYMRESARYSRFLLAAAELGKSDRPEYEEFKAMVHAMIDAWIEVTGDHRNDPAFQQRLHELVESLRR